MLWSRSKTDVLENLALKVSITSDVGCVRTDNEDCAIYLNPNGGSKLGPKDVLVIVADGMGGHAAGEVASRMAVDSISREFYRQKHAIVRKLKTCIETANLSIFDEAQKNEEYSGMGTTCAVLAIADGEAYGAHVGDSRIYHFRNGKMNLVTEDHSLVAELLRKGLISKTQARSHPDRNVVLRALGTRPQVEVSLWSKPILVRRGDQFILSTDGLHDAVDDDQILQAVSANDPQAACQQLVDLAKQRGGHDNITVAIVACTGSSEALKVVKDTRGV